ncbi:MAG: PEP-CTERM sorting domain-containing protein [Microcystis sp. LE19-84.1B]|jgi:hypothetical protein|uniref:PEP-CTERM sorting domain-containing protein n=1 Tax=Microcystis sp. LE19-84.1B TaxID=3016438 RepID=UPI0022BEA918|nr:PEP-CTERM sorting domain-containing protein [Microcystis sp. LE19-84.1B]MCZ8223501.1 PEP-CTERM sorting domain-containing protein [Microcystis sp. LE19-84.1B]
MLSLAKLINFWEGVKPCLSIASSTLLVGFLGLSNSAQALPLVVLQDSYTTTNPSTGTGVNPPNTFTSVADVGGTITYTVNQGQISVGFTPSIILFGGSTTSGSFFTVLNTIAGNPYEVDFTTVQGGVSSTHALKVNAFNGNGVGGTLLGNSGPVGINSSGNFTFTATSGQSTLEVLGILGTPNVSSDIAFDNLKVSTVAVPVPESEPLAMLGLVTVIGFGTGLQRKLAKNSQKK